uniref:Ankyrin repeat domain-containing protein n=1 Tax=Aotus nancymaae TaxID=37293 RepID=A0A2K5EXD2_AOTNA
MTGEKIRSLRRDHKPSKEEGDLLEPGNEEAAAALGGTFTKAGLAKAAKQLRPPPIPPGAPALPLHNSSVPATSQPSALLAGTNPVPVVANGGSCPAHYPVHECVFKGDVRRLSSLIRTHNIGQKDNHGNTPLHLAAMLGNKECAHLLLVHNAPVKVKNAQGWSPLAELKQQSRESVEEKRPRLLKALKELGDFYLELHWDFQSWVPLLSRILPSDACKIYKQGINIRLDTTLIDFTDMKCQRGHLSFIFNGDAVPSESFVVLDNEQKFIIGNFLVDFYLVNGLVLESRKRRERLSEEDILRNKAIMESLSKGGNIMEQNSEPVRRQSLTPPPQNTITWEEYISAENRKAPHLGRELVCKESKKTFKATIAMSQEFPLGIELLLNVLEVIAPFKHFNKPREFVQMKLPPGFPVKLDISVFPTITATVTFQEFQYDEFDGSIFTIPDDYKEDPSRFPDL